MNQINPHGHQRKKGLGANLILERHGALFLGRNRIALLNAIRETGSISKAARSIGISYKAAWDSVDAMNNLADKPLVAKATGGKNGGGAQLTPYGARLHEIFQTLEADYTNRLSNLVAGIEGFSEIQEAVSRFSVKTSARNQFAGVIKKIYRGAVNSEVTVDIGTATMVTAIVPISAVNDLGLRGKMPVFVIFPSSSVMISKDAKLKISARNQIAGKVMRMEKGAVNSEISLAFGEGKTICANISNGSVSRLGLKTGDAVSALIKATSIILTTRHH